MAWFLGFAAFLIASAIAIQAYEQRQRPKAEPEEGAVPKAPPYLPLFALAVLLAGLASRVGMALGQATRPSGDSWGIGAGLVAMLLGLSAPFAVGISFFTGCALIWRDKGDASVSVPGHALLGFIAGLLGLMLSWFVAAVLES